MKKRNKLKSKLLSILCSIGTLNGASARKTEGLGIMELLHGFNAFSKGLQNMMGVGWGMQTYLRAQKHNLKDRKFPWNPDLCPELFEENAANKYGFSTTFDDVMSLMIGRQTQKEILRQVSVDHIVNSAMNVRPNNTAIMAYGPSGTGKTKLIDLWERLFIANGFGSSLSNMPNNPEGPCRLRPADIDFSNKKVSFWNQLLENKKTSMGNDIPVKSELVAYVEANPNGGIIDIDEADKFMDKSVQEGLRVMIDEGTLRADGISYPLNNYIIVIKGNMNSDSVFGQEGTLTKQDIQTGLTSITISQSWRNRLVLVPFEPYSARELFDMFMSRLVAWENKYKNTGLRINIPKDTKTKLWKFLTDNPMQARAADKLYKRLTKDLYYIEKKLSNNKDHSERFVYDLLFDEEAAILHLTKNIPPAENIVSANIKSTSNTESENNHTFKSVPYKN